MTHPEPPLARKAPVSLSRHGHTRIDEYSWLRDDRREDPEVLTYLRAENRWFEQTMADTAELQNQLYEEMIGRLDPDDSSVPFLKRGYWYYYRYEPGLEYAIHARKKGTLDAPEEVLLNGNERAEGHAFYRLGNLEVSDDHRFIAIAEDTLSRGQHEVRVFDTRDSAFLPEVVENASSSLAWSECGHYLFYLLKHPDTLLAYRVMRHRLGTDPATDTLVYEEQDNRFYNALWRSRSGSFIMLGHHSTDTTEVQLLRADDPLGTFQPFLARMTGHEYDIDHAAGRFFVRSNWEAPNFKVMSTTEAHSIDMERWREWIGHRRDAMVSEIVAFDDWLVVAERKDGLRALRIVRLDNGEDRYLEGTETPAVLWPADNHSTDTRKLRYGYSSLVTPSQVWEVDLENHEKKLLKQDSVLGGYDPKHYRTCRLFCTARDGTRIPVSCVHHRNAHLDGRAPALVYAYGSYGASMDAWFRNSIISLLDRGFIYLIAHVRGGQELGRDWYEQGRQMNKWNTFHYFIDVTRELQDSGRIDPDRTYAMGGSAGGLLMGVVINETPECFHGVIAAVPFVDVVTTMLDDSIPLTTGEFDEWGNPNEQDAYRYMLSYSPYDQVKEQDYPHLMVTTGLHDSQVQYWEPAKWVARLRDRRTNHGRLILRTDMDAGHGGASGRYRQYREVSEEFAFLLDLASNTSP